MRRSNIAVVIGLIITAGLAFALSFDALTQLAIASNISPHLAWAYPLILDGVGCLSAVAAVQSSTQREARTRLFAWSVTGGTVLISLAANAIHAADGAEHLPVIARMVVGACPPVSLLASLEIVVRMIGRQAPVRATRPKRAAAQTPDARVEAKAASVAPRGMASTVAKETVIAWAKERFAETGEWPSGPVLGEKLGQSRKSGARLRARLAAETA
ncbi:hypothetical protein GCM10022286_00790 [Gryllotalpicola daejeonensis]|uniref:DUF2637 domain-containing protein n=1 Tax=Gryllotalpicola daejeonensis TaxID=993087 RepID=A0ABP7ZCY1_9MICO